VSLVGSDGNVLAHSSVLSAFSDVFKAMLASGMRESQQKVIELQSVSCAELRFLLRLLYTMQVDEANWSNDHTVAENSESIWLEVKIDANDDPFEFNGKRPSERRLKRTIDEASGIYSFAKSINGSPIFRNVDAEKGGLLYHCPVSTTRNNELCPDIIEESSWKISTCREAEGNMSRGNAIGEPSWTIGHASDDTKTPPLGQWTRPQRNLGSTEAALNAEVLKLPPLTFLLTAVKLARKYLIEHLYGLLDELVCVRLCPSTFSDILAAAIQTEHTALRMHCLRFAESSCKLRQMYDGSEFTLPEVVAELRSLWPPAPKKRCYRFV